MIHVRVSCEDPTDAARAGLEDFRDVRVERGARVDDRELVLADQIGVGAGSRHHAGVRCGEPRHVAVEALGDARLDDEAGVALFFRIAPVDLEIRRVGAPEQTLRAFMVERPAGGIDLDVAEALRVLERRLRRLDGSEVLERAAGRKDQFNFAAPAALERVARADPEAVHRLGPVVSAFLSRRRASDEEARAEAPRPARGGDPVAVVGDVLSVNEKVLLFQEFAEQQRSGIQGFAERFQRFGPPWIDWTVAVIKSQKNSRLLEALARRGDPVRKAARRQAEARAGPRVIQAAHAPRGALAGIVGIERAAGKHERARQERRLAGALKHEYFGCTRRSRPCVIGFTQQEDGRRWARLELAWTQALRPARSLSFWALILARMFSQSASESWSRPVKPAPLAR